MNSRDDITTTTTTFHSLKFPQLFSPQEQLQEQLHEQQGWHHHNYYHFPFLIVEEEQPHEQQGWHHHNYYHFPFLLVSMMFFSLVLKIDASLIAVETKLFVAAVAVDTVPRLAVPALSLFLDAGLIMDEMDNPK
jgi:hypothetical protein